MPSGRSPLELFWNGEFCLGAIHPLRNFPVRPILKSAIAKLTTATASGILLLCTSSTTRAAERFSFRYGPLGGSLPISSLEAFAADGTIDSHLNGYLRYLDAETLVQVRDALSSPHLVDPVVFSQMLYTPMGEQLLQSTGLTIQTGAGLNGRFALRSALIEAAAHPKGLSLIEILRSFPTREINLNLNRVLTVKRDVERSVRQTSDLIDFVKQQSAKDAAANSFDYTVLATAGATLDFEELRRHCDREVVFASNLSQFLQCRALELETSPEDVELLTGGGLRDERIQLVMAFNPVSRLFGKTGASRIKIPILIAGGSHDFVTPVMPEQADIFRRLTTPEKYFLLTDRASHTNEITRGILQFFSTLDDQEMGFQASPFYGDFLKPML
ncbi:MAG: alpha/beta hydrolase [Spirulina sp.]